MKGGYRPNAGGARPGAGRPKKGQVKQPTAAVDPAAVMSSLPSGSKTPLEYMLAVMNDAAADEARRDRMAIASAPFVHPRAADQGKKETKVDAAKLVADSGRFMTAEPPRVQSTH